MHLIKLFQASNTIRFAPEPDMVQAGLTVHILFNSRQCTASASMIAPD
jgi:hypothetical protein